MTCSLTYPTVSTRKSSASSVALSPFVLSGMQTLQKQSNQSITTSDGIKLAYVHAGSRTSAPVVVLIHGWSGSKAYWELNVGGLAKQCRVFAYDQRFHGESGKPRHVRALLWRAKDCNSLFYSHCERNCGGSVQAEHTGCSNRLHTGVAAAYCCSFCVQLARVCAEAVMLLCRGTMSTGLQRT